MEGNTPQCGEVTVWTINSKHLKNTVANIMYTSHHSIMDETWGDVKVDHSCLHTNHLLDPQSLHADGEVRWTECVFFYWRCTKDESSLKKYKKKYPMITGSCIMTYIDWEIQMYGPLSSSEMETYGCGRKTEAVFRHKTSNTFPTVYIHPLFVETFRKPRLHIYFHLLLSLFPLLLLPYITLRMVKEWVVCPGGLSGLWSSNNDFYLFRPHCEFKVKHCRCLPLDVSVSPAINKIPWDRTGREIRVLNGLILVKDEIDISTVIYWEVHLEYWSLE